MTEDPKRTTRRKREVPTFGRGTRLYSGVSSNPVTGTDDDTSVYVFYSEDDGFFELTTHDDGHWPVDELHTAVWVEPENVPELLRALGGKRGDNPAELFAQHVKNGSIGRNGIANWVSENDIPHTSHNKYVSNL